MRATRPLALVAALAGLGTAPAAAETCPGLFAEGQVPVVVNAKLAMRTQALCFEAFAVLHSGVTRTPLYSAEHLTRASVAAARTVARDDAFHEEPRLPVEDRARLEDYVRSGYDRGHLSPAGDMPTETAQAQSFTLANVVPQDRSVNRGLWSDIEESVRRLATRRGSIFVVTGVIFSGGSVREIGSGVLVPTQLYKALYDPATGEAGAYLVANEAGQEWQGLSLDALRAAAGIDVFPGLPPAAKATAMTLPDPHAFSRSADTARPGTRQDEGWRDRLVREMMRAVRKAVREFLRGIF
ncbi:DNA/RNA non-specific endonuclease [Methylobacterium sp. J-076]|nr:DNA/RNA non-specific endonuclease [Methylobacterium sp. J-076]MCJ2013310.1 DNA/RNA non-specific endonuclease [Methylobacterium sp. J-076]